MRIQTSEYLGGSPTNPELPERVVPEGGDLDPPDQLPVHDYIEEFKTRIGSDDELKAQGSVKRG